MTRLAGSRRNRDGCFDHHRSLSSPLRVKRAPQPKRRTNDEGPEYPARESAWGPGRNGVGIGPSRSKHRGDLLIQASALRRARVCYDHLAGELGVRLLDRMRERQLVRGDDEFLELTAPGEKWASELGIDLDGLRRKSRPLVRSCLDWSERRSHLSGALGAAILERLFELRFAKRDPFSRAVLISSRGETFLASLETHYHPRS